MGTIPIYICPVVLEIVMNTLLVLLIGSLYADLENVHKLSFKRNEMEVLRIHHFGVVKWANKSLNQPILGV